MKGLFLSIGIALLFAIGCSDDAQGCDTLGVMGQRACVQSYAAPQAFVQAPMAYVAPVQVQQYVAPVVQYQRVVQQPVILKQQAIVQKVIQQPVILKQQVVRQRAQVFRQRTRIVQRY